MPTPGDRIKALREEHGWTQEALAERAQMSKGFLSDLENNKRNVSADLRPSNRRRARLSRLTTSFAASRPKSGNREEQPFRFPPELSVAAQDLNLSSTATHARLA